jgi:hypothetical protein
VLHAPDEAALPSEIELPLSRDAKLEIFLRTCGLPHSGQTTSSTALLLRTSSSNDSEHSLHSNSKMGMVSPKITYDFLAWKKDRQYHNCQSFDA